MTTSSACATDSAPRKRLPCLTAALMMLAASGWHAAMAEIPIAAGDEHTCAVVFGRLQCWGSNYYGQLGDGTGRSSTYPRAVIGLTGAVAEVVAGESYTCAIVDQALMCWGKGYDHVPATVSGFESGVTAVAGGWRHTCAVRNGGLLCWGSNDSGQLGTGDNLPRSEPVQVFAAGSAVTAVTGGERHTCAVVAAQVWCWGDNFYGQSGTGSTSSDPEPPGIVDGTNGAINVATGAAHSCALVSGGQVRCWGFGGHGELGQGAFADSPSPVTVIHQPPDLSPLTGVTAISIGADGLHTCAATAAGAYCWGYNDSGQLGDSLTSDAAYAKPVTNLSGDVTAIAAGADHACAAAGGSVLCWGRDEYGQLGDGGISPYRSTSLAIAQPFTLGAVSAGKAHGCGRTSSGSVQCWGWNRDGQLGDGSHGYAGLPVDVTGLWSSSGIEIASVTAGDLYSCALADNGEVRCWGNNGAGQLGNGTYVTSPVPTSVINLGNAIRIDAGYAHTCAVLDTGRAKCWGLNGQGQLGDGTHTGSPAPSADVIIGGGSFPLPLTGVSAMSAGYAHSCAIANGRLYCWGYNFYGQLGNGSENNSQVAALVVGIDPPSDQVSMVSAGGNHTCAVVDGGVRCWGFNYYGQLGNGGSDDSSIPVAVSGISSGATAVSAGYEHTCAVVDGGVQCWGSGGQGQLGNGTFAFRSLVPVTAIPAGSGIVSVTAGEQFTCAVDPLDVTSCWGNGMYGRLANGDLGLSDEPVPVIDRIFVGDLEEQSPEP